MTDKIYEAARNKLIPQAARHADEKHGKTPGHNRDRWNIEWTLTYLAKMDGLWQEKENNKRFQYLNKLRVSLSRKIKGVKRELKAFTV